MLLCFSYFTAIFIKYGRITPPRSYSSLFYIFVGCWFAASLAGKKFKPSAYGDFLSGIRTLFNASLFLGYCLSFVIVMSGQYHYSRWFLFGVWSGLLGGEFLLYRVGYKKITSPAGSAPGGEKFSFSKWTDLSYSALILDFGLLAGSFMMVNYIKRGHLHLLHGYDKLFLIIIGLWFVSSVWTKKYCLKAFRNFYFLAWQWIKSAALTAVMLAAILYGFNLFTYSRGQAFGTILALMLLELILLFGYKVFIAPESRKKEDIESIDAVKQTLMQEPLATQIDFEAVRKKMMAPAAEKVRQETALDFPGVFDFLDKTLDLKDIRNIETTLTCRCDRIMNDPDAFPRRLIAHLAKINDVRRLNLFFLGMHQSLVPGGYWVGYGHTLSTHREYIFSKFPGRIAGVVYFMDFIFRRILPKLPICKTIYFSLTKGRRRLISRAEFLGRLCFCGFEIVATQTIDKRFWVVARKVSTPSLDKNPTYGPLVSLRRSGFEGKLINVYKFRTMHPYSEYLQQYIYDHNGLQKGGKIEDDFRMTGWGRLMRKGWLDELPMLYNWLRGDLQLVGVRPLSLQYLSLYDKELQTLRKKVRPGLIPPFYADLPETFDEICESERRYIQAFLNHPVKTQCIYFWKAVVNIVFKGARSN